MQRKGFEDALITERNRITYFIMIIMVMILGLAARRFSFYLPEWINAYLGDVLWALMIFLMVGFLFNRRDTKQIALIALLFSFSIEVSQLYHADWIDSLRSTRFGGLVLGYGFLWRDLLSYSMGVGIGAITEIFILHPSNK